MQTTKTFIIECSRSNAENVDLSENTKSTSNASWTNLVNFNFETGDQVNLEYSVIHDIGEEGDTTVEISGANDQTTGLTDNINGIKFTNYICNNGYNTLALPYVGSLKFKESAITSSAPQYYFTVFASDSPEDDWDVDETFTFDDNPNYSGRVLSVYSDTNQPNRFELTGTEYWVDWFFQNGSNGLLISGSNGHKSKPATMTKAQEPNLRSLENYQMIGMTIRQDKTDDFTMSINHGMPIETDGYNFKFAYEPNSTPQIVSPNNIFTSYALPLSSDNKSCTKSIDGTKFIKLATNYAGPYRRTGSSVDDQSFYSDSDTLETFDSEIIFKVDAPTYESPSVITNIINEKLHETYALDEQTDDSELPKDVDGRIMPHVSGPLNKIISCGGYSNFWNEIAVKDLNAWKGIHAMMRCELAFSGNLRFKDNANDYLVPRPAIAIDGTKCQTNVYGQEVIETSCLPRTRKEFTFTALNNGNSIGSTTQDVYYSTIPKYFLITTNIKYNQANINRLKIWFKNNEIYDGVQEDLDKANDDKENWRVMADLGSSNDGVNQTDTQGNTSEYKPNGYFYRYLTTGKPVISGATNYDPFSVYAYSYPIDPYDVHNRISNFGYNAVSPRSDIFAPGTNVTVYNDVYKIDSVQTDVPVRFMDSKDKKVSMAIFSRLLDDYESKVMTSTGNLPENSDQWHEGEGKYSLDPTSGGMRTDLSEDMGIYGVNIVKEEGDVEVFTDLTPDGNPTYWKAAYYSSFQPGLELQTTAYIYKIIDATEGDRVSNGGYQMLMYDDESSFGDLSYIYIYSSRNSDYKEGQTTFIDAATFNDGALSFDNQDEDHLLFYFDATHMWLGVKEEDINDFHKYRIYKNDDMPDTEEEFLPFRFYESIDDDKRDVSHIYICTDTTASSSASSWTIANHVPGDANNNLDVTEVRLTAEQVCAFMLYADAATKTDDGWEISEDFPLPAIYQTLFFGKSPSFIDNPVVWTINPMSSDDNLISGQENAQRFISIGANDPTCEFDSSLSRAKFFNLHTQRKLGITEMPTDSDGNFVNTTLGQEVVKMADTSYTYQKFDNVDYNDLHTDFVYKTPAINNGLSMSVSGLFIKGIYGQEAGNLKSSTSEMIELTDEKTFFNSLLYKLGFLRENFFTDYGLSWKNHVPSLQKDNSLANRYKKVKPLTTNAYFNISSQPSFSLHDSSLSGALGEPTYQLEFPGKAESSIDGSTSTEILASNLPTKLESPFYQIYCDIVNTDYYTNKQTMNIVGIVPKNYISGDFVYGFSTSYNLPVLFPQKINSVSVEVRLPNGELAPIDAKSSVLFKVQRPITFANILDVEKNISKKNK